MRRGLRSFLEDRYPQGERVVVCGDFNNTFGDRDVFDPDGLREHLHFTTAP